jgi:hypothetical protein
VPSQRASGILPEGQTSPAGRVHNTWEGENGSAGWKPGSALHQHHRREIPFCAPQPPCVTVPSTQAAFRFVAFLLVLSAAARFDECAGLLTARHVGHDEAVG